MKIPVSFRTAYARADKQILVVSGATDNFIHPRLIKRLALGTQRLERPWKIWNIDGTNNKAGRIAEYVVRRGVRVSSKRRSSSKEKREVITRLGENALG